MEVFRDYFNNTIRSKPRGITVRIYMSLSHAKTYADFFKWAATAYGSWANDVRTGAYPEDNLMLKLLLCANAVSFYCMRML